MNNIPENEGLTVEFKSSFNIEVIETLVAFANSKGGSVYIGVNDKRKIVGVTLNKETVQQLVNEVKSKTAPILIPDAEVLEYDEKQIIQLSIKEYPIKPVSVQGRYFKRIKNSTHQMTINEVVNMHLQTMNSSWDAYIDPIHSIEDLSLEKVQKAIVQLRSRGRNITEDPLSFLVKYDMLREDKITNAAFLLFHKNDHIISTIELGFFQSDIIIKDSSRSKSDLLSQIDEVIDFVKKHINKEIIITGNPQNTERWQYPLEAIREIVLNMIVHRNYQSPADSIVKVFPNKIEFFNPGLLPEEITIDDLLNNNYKSTPRNKVIADFCKDLGLIEKYGSGIRRVIDLCQKEGMTIPQISQISNGINVAFIAKENITPQVTPQVTPQATPQVMNENIQNLYSKLTDGQEYSREEIMNILSLADRKYVQESYIKPLIDLGLLILKYPNTPKHPKQRYICKK